MPVDSSRANGVTKAAAGPLKVSVDRAGTLQEFSGTYRFGKVVCSGGSFGQVVRVLYIPLKQVRIARRLLLDVDGDRVQTDIAHTFHQLAGIVHPRLLSMKHLFFLPASAVNESAPMLVLTMELASGGELFDNIVAAPKYTEQEVQSIVQSLLVGLAVLHEAGMAHGRLIPSALLLGEKLKFGTLKICDPLIIRCSVANVLRDTAAPPERSRKLVQRSVPGFASPEEYASSSPEGQNAAESRDTENAERSTDSNSCPEEAHESENSDASTGIVGASDIWAVGVLMYTMLSGFQPFTATTLSELIERTRDQPVEFPKHLGWAAVSSTAQEFLVALLAKSAAERPTARQCLLHPWMMEDLAASPPLESARRGIQKLQMRRKFKVGVDAAREKAAAAAAAAAQVQAQSVAEGSTVEGL